MRHIDAVTRQQNARNDALRQARCGPHRNNISYEFSAKTGVFSLHIAAKVVC
jgi:hypothetical protein